jgi:hypothetical protein
MLLDLLFAVRRGRTRGRKRSREDEVILQALVNDTTVRLAPEEPVKELGNVLPRILDFMAAVPAEEHINFSKMDLANSYWRMLVELEARWNFAYVIPSAPGTPTCLVVPSALQMGWNESPGYFVRQQSRSKTLPSLGLTRGPKSPDTRWKRSPSQRSWLDPSLW